jgi:hypothetical protein
MGRQPFAIFVAVRLQLLVLFFANLLLELVDGRLFCGEAGLCAIVEFLRVLAARKAGREQQHCGEHRLREST